MAQFKALCGKRCRYINDCLDAFKVRPLGTDTLTNLLENFRVIHDNILEA